MLGGSKVESFVWRPEILDFRRSMAPFSIEDSLSARTDCVLRASASSSAVLVREETGFIGDGVVGDSQRMTPVENKTSELARVIPPNGPVRFSRGTTF